MDKEIQSPKNYDAHIIHWKYYLASKLPKFQRAIFLNSLYGKFGKGFV